MRAVSSSGLRFSPLFVVGTWCHLREPSIQPTNSTFVPKHFEDTMEDPQQDYSDSDDELLAAAAAHWSRDPSSSSQRSESTAPPPHPSSHQPEKNWSLHITQLSYDASDYDIRNLFISHGCLVTSVRLVYDRGDRGQRTFRGTAFVDVKDEESFHKALELHRTKVLNRRINVRATKSKQELSDIVEATKAKVSQMMMTRKKNKLSNSNSSNDKTNDGTKSVDVTSSTATTNAAVKADNKSPSTPDKKKEKRQQRKKEKLSNKKGPRTGSKPTKKERNRRAAIIASKKAKGARVKKS